MTDRTYKYNNNQIQHNPNIKILQYDDVHSLCDTLGYWFPSGKAPYDVFIFGVRADIVDQSADQFNDVIGIAYIDGFHRKNVEYFKATTDPALSELLHPTFRAAQLEGTAILKEGQYRGVYELDVHGTGAWQHPALVQRGRLKIYRDNDRDNILDFDVPITNGFWGINIHASSLWTDMDNINGYSAGCQVFSSGPAYYRFIDIIQQQIKFGLGKKFSYTLFTQTQWNTLSQ